MSDDLNKFVIYALEHITAQWDTISSIEYMTDIHVNLSDDEKSYIAEQILYELLYFYGFTYQCALATTNAFLWSENDLRAAVYCAYRESGRYA